MHSRNAYEQEKLALLFIAVQQWPKQGMHQILAQWLENLATTTYINNQQIKTPHNHPIPANFDALCRPATYVRAAESKRTINMKSTKVAGFEPSCTSRTPIPTL